MSGNWSKSPLPLPIWGVRRAQNGTLGRFLSNSLGASAIPKTRAASISWPFDLEGHLTAAPKRTLCPCDRLSLALVRPLAGSVLIWRLYLA